MSRLGVSGQRILKSEPWKEIKCFHAGGEAKNWLHGAREMGMLDGGTVQDRPGQVIPFVELTPADYARELAFKRVLHALGFYQIFRAV
jgi:hypothetical protein